MRITYPVWKGYFKGETSNPSPHIQQSAAAITVEKPYIAVECCNILAAASGYDVFSYASIFPTYDSYN